MRLVALSLFGLLSLALLGIGALYLITSEFMPYHSAAIETQWSDLNSNYQGLYLGFLKGLGAGSFCVGSVLLAMCMLSVRRGASAYKWLLAMLSILYWSLLTYATYTVYINTPGEPPLEGGVAMILLAIVASVLLFLAERRQGDT